MDELFILPSHIPKQKKNMAHQRKKHDTFKGYGGCQHMPPLLFMYHLFSNPLSKLNGQFQFHGIYFQFKYN